MTPTKIVAAWSIDPRLERAHAHARNNEVLQAQLLYQAVLRDHPSCTPAARALAAFAQDRDDFDQACSLLTAALKHAPEDTAVLLSLAQVLWQLGLIDDALRVFESIVKLDPNHHVAWLLLADIRDISGNADGALRARYQAVSRAQAQGQWVNRESTDSAMLEVVMRNIEQLRKGERQAYFDSYQNLRDSYGGAAFARVEHALNGYLGEWDATPPDSRQRPKFFYFPDLPQGPYHDPMLHSWAPALREAWLDIRQEAVDLLALDRDFESFLGLKPGQSREGYVGGANPNAAWDAYFFYRHGKRYDENNLRCPKTSAALDAVELCHVARQAPEVCFSVLRPQSTIVAHYGVTNTRLVMHLPLIVPRGCALNIIGAGEHHWREGELMMFDDTFQHEAWNNSDEPRLIVLMDCWNPHLTELERLAVRQVVEAIDSVQN